MKKIISLLFVAGVLNTVAAQKITMYSTTASERWTSQKVTVLKHASQTPEVSVYMDSLLQHVTGFGGTFNEIAGMRFKVSQEERDKVMASLFVEEGVRFSLGRTPVACSDYSFGYYSYNDVKDDYTMRNFSIDRDRFILIPYIKEALKLRPDLKMWASPWTPPAWMKVNEHYSQKSSGIEGTDIGHNRLDPARNVLGNVTGFKMQQGYLQAYALYFSKYVQAYKKNGITISMLMP